MTRAGGGGDRGGGPASNGWAASAARLEPLVVGFVALGVGLLVLSFINRGVLPITLTYSAEYELAARAPLWSTERWLGTRTVLLPLALSAAGNDLVGLVELQVRVAALSWAALAASVAGALPPGWRRWLAGAVVVGLSLSWPIAMWDQEVLTESLALSGLALVAAAAVWAVRSPAAPRAAALLAAVAAWLAVRDGHVVPVVLAGLGVLAWAWRDRGGHRRLAALTGAYLVALALVVAGSADFAGRGRVPLEHVFEVRVLAYPERMAWFEGHGMPQGDQLAAVPPVTAPGLAPWTYLAVDDPTWDEWRRWLASDGRGTLLRYAVEHPGYVFWETRERPERVFNNLHGLEAYRPLALREVAGTTLLTPPVAITVLLAAAAGILVLRRRTERSPLSVVGLVLVVTSLPHAAAAWHSDGMESARHLLLPGTQLRVGTVLLLAGALLAPAAPVAAPAARARRTGPAAPRPLIPERTGPRPTPGRGGRGRVGPT